LRFTATQRDQTVVGKFNRPPALTVLFGISQSLDNLSVGQSLTVNADVKGQARVRLLDADRKPLDGFDVARKYRRVQ